MRRSNVAAGSSFTQAVYPSREDNVFPDHTKLSPTFSCKFNLCSAVAVNHTLRLLKHVKNPGMVSWSDTQHVPRQSSLPRRCYPSIAWMRHTSEMTYASHGVPMKASADGRSKQFAIAIAQCEERPAISPNGRCFRHRKIWE